MMNNIEDKTSKAMLWSVIGLLLIGLILFAMYVKATRERDAIAKMTQTAQEQKTELKATQLISDKSKAEYTATRESNIKHEKSIAAETIAECDSLDDTAILFEFADLIQRAKEYNRAHRN